MSKLVGELGSRYVNDFFNGALFVHEGKLHRFEALLDNATLSAFTLEPLADGCNYTYRRRNLPANLLESFKTFSWPKLGYRNMETQGVINAPFVTAQRSTQRGMRDDLLQYGFSPAGRLYMSATESCVPSNNMIQSVFFPKWYSYRQALRLLKENKAVAVALNEDIALSRSVSSQDTGILYDISFRDKVVGHIRDDGNIVYKNKSINNMNMFKKLTFQEV